MDNSKRIDHVVIYITIVVALLKYMSCQQYRDLQGLTLLPGSSLKDTNDVRSLIECIVVCKQIGGECYAVSWNETGTWSFQNYYFTK